MLTAIAISLAVVFVAELGDKSQLIAMTYALRHRWWVVLSGVGLAALLVHGLSVAIGHFLGLTLPDRPIAFAAAIAFVLFAVWTWRSARTGDDGDIRVAETRWIIPAIVSSFVLAELGDKTMLATVTLASDHRWSGVWIGATVGMVAADAVAIAAGAFLHKRLPVRFLHNLASVLFLSFGVWLLFDAALQMRWAALLGTGSVVALASCGLLVSLVRRRRASPGGLPAPTAPRY
ncbi:TMEM165/GDT1 family protein [Mycolicibacterium sp. XJ662]